MGMCRRKLQSAATLVLLLIIHSSVDNQQIAHLASRQGLHRCCLPSRRGPASRAAAAGGGGRLKAAMHLARCGWRQGMLADTVGAMRQLGKRSLPQPASALRRSSSCDRSEEPKVSQLMDGRDLQCADRELRHQ